MSIRFCDKFFYHIYPLGLCGCPRNNDFACPPGNGFARLEGELDRIASLGVNALYIGPLFESSSHGYDTVDYYHVDRRLGNNQSFSHFCAECHRRGIAVVLDAVFNHTGRDFFAFKDVQQNREHSAYKSWYLNMRFDRGNELGDSFDYEGWSGHKQLVKLDVDNPAVREHLFGAVSAWAAEFGIDGLRLDAADVLSKSFLDALRAHCSSIKQDFWLMGEVVHGNYRDWVCDGRLDSVTNYQLYKALWSSLNDQNMFELAHNLSREFAAGGMYEGDALYNFADNHDVDRVASVIKEQAHLHLLYALMFVIPGIPSVYYGSEYAVRGVRTPVTDAQLRPSLPPFAQGFPDFAVPQTDGAALSQTIARLARVRAEHEALRRGSYAQVAVQNRSLVFSRSCETEQIVVAVNSDDAEQAVRTNLDGTYEDVLNGGTFSGQSLASLAVPRRWLRVLLKK